MSPSLVKEGESDGDAAFEPPERPMMAFLPLGNIPPSTTVKMPSRPLTTSTSAPLRAFPLFPQLPGELRLKIWRHAAHSRVVEVRYDPRGDTCLSRTPVPAILHTTRESRYEALRLYQLCFRTRSQVAARPADHAARPPGIYFNPAVDMLYLPRHRSMGYDETLRDFRSFLAVPEQLHDVTWLALDYVNIEIKRPWEAYNKTVLIRSFPSLKEIFLVVSKHHDPPSLPDVGGSALLDSAAPTPTIKPLSNAPPAGPAAAAAPELPAGVTETLVLCKDRSQDVFRIWSTFRRAVGEESRMLEQLAAQRGEPVAVPFAVPAVRVVERGRNETGGLDWMAPGMLPVT